MNSSNSEGHLRARHGSELQRFGFGQRGQGQEVAKGETIKEGPYTAEIVHWGSGEWGEGKGRRNLIGYVG